MNQYEKDLEKKIEEITCLWQADIALMEEFKDMLNEKTGLIEILEDEMRSMELANNKSRQIEQEELFYENEILRKENSAMGNHISDLEKQLEEVRKNKSSL